MLALGLVLLWQETAGGQAFTTESLRRAEVERSPQPLPDLQLLDAAGQATSLRALLAGDERTWIVDFVYTRCQTVCSALGGVFQQLQQRIDERGLRGRVGLLTISFDPERDDPPALQAYAQRMRAGPEVWSVVTLARATDRRSLLDAFGIMVIPAPYGEFEHNAALHVVHNGRLLHIVGYEAVEDVIALALAAGPP